MSNYKMGRLPAVHDSRTLMYEDYRARRPMVPPSNIWSNTLTSLGLMGNDRYGDCTWAAVCHILQLLSSHNPPQIIIPDADVIAGYLAMTGGADNGLAIINVLQHWKKVGISGTKILGYMSVNWTQPQRIMEATYLFGNVNIGVMLPDEAFDQFHAGAPWDSGSPNSANGHSVPIVDYDSVGVTVITWGRLQRATWRWVLSCTEEAWTMLSHRWVNVAGRAPNALNWVALVGDLAKIH